MGSVLENGKKGLFFIISAPAGTGKTTLVQMLVKEFPSVIASISYTTRLPRQGEISGQDYHFISEAMFQEKIATADFLEYVNLYGHYYGTSLQWVRSQQDQGKHVILVIDTQGALKLKEQKFKAVYVFIRPPSLDVLKKRLIDRQTETEEKIERRLEWAKREIQAAPYYDYQIINDDLSRSYEILRSIVIAECHRTQSI
jgi:guanylate kinase